MTTQSAVLCSFTLTTASREPGMYGRPSRFAITPSSPAASKRSSQAVAASSEVVAGEIQKPSPRASSSCAPLLERALVDGLAVPEQQVEGDEDRRDLGRELADAALGRVQPHLHRVEVEHAVAGDHDLAVERGVGREQVAERRQLGEVAQQRAAVPRPERELAAVVLEHAAEAVPLRLVLPAVAGRQLADELGLHRREGDVRAGHVCKATAMGELDGEWQVPTRRRPAAAALRRPQADRRRGRRDAARHRADAPFDVVGRELRYRGRLSRGLVDTVAPGEDGWWDGVARYRGRELGRFAMRRVER